MADRVQLETAGDALAAWAWWTARMRQIVRRPYAVIDGEVSFDVLYHAPEAMR